MKSNLLIVIMTAVMTVGCGTLGGAMQGAGEDLSRAGEYVRSVGK